MKKLDFQIIRAEVYVDRGGAAMDQVVIVTDLPSEGVPKKILSFFLLQAQVQV